MFHCTEPLTLVLLNPSGYPAFANSADPDQVTSEEANWSGSALFGIQYVNLYQQPGSSTVNSRYLEVQGTLWNTSRYQYLDISDLQNKGKNKSNDHISHICNLSSDVRDILKILWKRAEFPLFVSYQLLDFHVKTRTRFSLWDKPLFEISEVEITRVRCNLNGWKLEVGMAS